MKFLEQRKKKTPQTNTLLKLRQSILDGLLSGSLSVGGDKKQTNNNQID